MTTVETVADAIQRADNEFRKANGPADDYAKRSYEAMAEAAISAMADRILVSEDQAIIAARITELLDTANHYLEEARQARRERDALLVGFKGMAAAMTVALNGGAR